MGKPRTCLYDTVVEDSMAILPLCLAGEGHALVKRDVYHEKKADVGNATNEQTSSYCPSHLCEGRKFQGQRRWYSQAPSCRVSGTASTKEEFHEQESAGVHHKP